MTRLARALLLALVLMPMAKHGSAQRQRVNLLCVTASGFFRWPDIQYLEFTASYINNNLSHLFPSFELNITYMASEGTGTGSAAKAFMDGYLKPPNKALLLGAAFSQQSQIIAEIAQYYYLPQIGYSNIAPSLSDRSKYPYFIRLSTTTSLFVEPTIALLKMYNWQKFGFLTSDSDLVYSSTLDLEAAFIRNNLTSYMKFIFSDDATNALNSVKMNDIRILVVIRMATTEANGKRFECLLQQMGLYGPKYFLIQIGFPYTNSDFANSCPDSDRAQSLEGSMEFDSVVFDPALIETRVGIAEKNISALYPRLLERFPSIASSATQKGIGGFDVRFDSLMTAAVALNETLKRFNYTEVVQLSNSSFKAGLFANIMRTNFFGLTGRVQFDSRGDRSSVVQFYQLRSDMSRDLVATFDPATQKIDWLKNLWFSGTTPPVDAPEVETVSLLIGSPAAIFIIVASSIGIALSVAAVAVNFRFRELRFIKMSSPLVNNVIGAGCLMCYASCIVMAVNSQWSVTTAKCWAQTALLTLGYSAAFGAMLAKTWRVHRIFTNVKLRRMAIKDSHLFGVILLLLATDVIILTAWAIADPLTTQRSFLASGESVDGTQQRLEVEKCTSERLSMWLIILIGIKGLMLVVALIFAWETRGVQLEALNDSKTIGVCVYNTTVMGLIGVALLFVLPDSGQSLRVILLAACIILCATTTLLLVFGSKIFLLVKLGPAAIESMASNQASVGLAMASKQ